MSDPVTAQCDVLRFSCPAKVNLALSVGSAASAVSRDATSGLHPIASWMVAVTFADELSLRRTAGESIFDIAYADDALLPEPIDWPLERDLAVRAHRLMESYAGRPLAVAATLRKRIPTGAGLGGGSSNAAAMLIGLNELFGLECQPAAMVDLARALGSDVPFLVRAMLGEPGAVVTGVGAEISPAPPVEPIHLVLLLPPLRCATGRVYAAFDALTDGTAELDEARVRVLAAKGRVATGDLFNDLARPAEHVTPGLADLRMKLAELVGDPVHLTGSGAAMFVVAGSAQEAARLAARVTAQAASLRLATKAVATRTLAPRAAGVPHGPAEPV